MEETGERLPVIISGTVTDASGRILSGQTVSAFWHSVRHARPLAIGLNCALGAALMRPYIEELARVAGDTFISCYPNAGLPNPMSDTGFDETPEITGRLLEEFARAGFLNIAGGCCGTTPEHIAEIAQRVGRYRPRCCSASGLLPRSGRLTPRQPRSARRALADQNLEPAVGRRRPALGSPARTPRPGRPARRVPPSSRVRSPRGRARARGWRTLAGVRLADDLRPRPAAVRAARARPGRASRLPGG